MFDDNEMCMFPLAPIQGNISHTDVKKHGVQIRFRITCHVTTILFIVLSIATNDVIHGQLLLKKYRVPLAPMNAQNQPDFGCPRLFNESGLSHAILL